MNTLEHPNSFELARVKYSVAEVDYLSGENLGIANGNSCTIQLALHTQRSPVPKDKRINTFYHELVHQMLFAIDFDDLTKDEKFVTGMGNMLHEFDLTRDIVPIKIEEGRKTNIKVVNAPDDFSGYKQPDIKIIDEKNWLSTYQLAAIKEVKQQASVKVEHELNVLVDIVSKLKEGADMSFVNNYTIAVGHIEKWIEMMHKTFVEIPDTYEIKQSTGIRVDNPRIAKEEDPMKKLYQWPISSDMAFMRDPTLKTDEDLDVSSESKGD